MSKKVRVRTYCRELHEHEYILEVPDNFDASSWATEINNKVDNWNGEYISKRSVLSSSLKEIVNVRKVNEEEIATIISVEEI